MADLVMTRALARLLRGLAQRLDPDSGTPMLPAPGDPITLVVAGDGELYEVHGIVDVAWTDRSGQALTRLVVREVKG